MCRVTTRELGLKITCRRRTGVRARARRGRPPGAGSRCRRPRAPGRPRLLGIHGDRGWEERVELVVAHQQDQRVDGRGGRRVGTSSGWSAARRGRSPVVGEPVPEAKHGVGTTDDRRAGPLPAAIRSRTRRPRPGSQHGGEMAAEPAQRLDVPPGPYPKTRPLRAPPRQPARGDALGDLGRRRWVASRSLDRPALGLAELPDGHHQHPSACQIDRRVLPTVSPPGCEPSRLPRPHRVVSDVWRYIVNVSTPDRRIS